MKDVSMHVMRETLKRLPDARTHFNDKGDALFFVQVPTLLAKVIFQELRHYDEPPETQEIRSVFRAEESVKSDRGGSYYDWVLIGQEVITMI